MSEQSEITESPKFRDFYLVVLFHPTLVLAIIEEWPGPKIWVGSQCFQIMPFEEKYNFWSAHYDWLRTQTGELLGVRYIPVYHEARFLEDVIKDLPYISPLGYGVFEIFFGDRRDFDEELSTCQAFGGNHIYQSDDQTYLMTFGLHWSGFDEYLMLKSLESDWINLRMDYT
ncbi:MAG: hypothetical protein HY774_07550 [Acidobacteria bacterium]|nr:hypothetical protein [Acidobacteriota bacterium]